MRNYRVGRASLGGDASKLHLELAGALVSPHRESASVLDLFNGDGDVSWQSLPAESRCATCATYYDEHVSFLEL
jgi:hypothetical protein